MIGTVGCPSATTTPICSTASKWSSPYSRHSRPWTSGRPAYSHSRNRSTTCSAPASHSVPSASNYTSTKHASRRSCAPYDCAFVPNILFNCPGNTEEIDSNGQACHWQHRLGHGTQLAPGHVGTDNLE